MTPANRCRCAAWLGLASLPWVSGAACSQSAFPPYAASDPTVLVDIGITALAPRNTWGSLPSGFSLHQVSGLSAGSLSNTRGFIPNHGGYIANPVAFPGAGSTQGTVYMRLQRAALAVDDSTDGGGNFFDSTGNTSGGFGSQLATAFTLFDGDTSLIQWVMNVQATFAQILDAGAWVTPGVRYANSHGSPNLDANDMDIVLTWKGTTYWSYLDGVPVGYGSLRQALPASGQFAQVVIGGYLNGSGNSGQPLGPFAIQRFQLSTAYSPPPVLTGQPLIGFYGDSFVVQGGGVTGDVVNLSGSPTAAQVNSVQAQLSPTAAPNASNGSIGQDGFVARVQAYALQHYGGYLTLYTAAESGHGWAYTGMGGTSAANTRAIDDFTLHKTGFSDALNAAQPDYLFAFGSVNDVNNGTPGDIVGDTEAHFAYWADNNPNLKGIYYIEPLSWELATGACQSHGGPAGWKAEMARQRGLLRAALSHGFAAGTRKVPVTYIESYESWVEGAGSARFLIGSNPDNHTSSSSTGSTPNGHPDAEGDLQMADAYVWPYVTPLLATKGTAGKDTTISAGQNALFQAGQKATLTITPTGTGPFTYQWYVGTSGDTASPIAGATGATFSTPPLSAGTNYWVRVTTAAGVVENSTTITLAVTASSGTGAAAGSSDGPMPPWALGLLGMALAGITMRRLRSDAH